MAAKKKQPTKDVRVTVRLGPDHLLYLEHLRRSFGDRGKPATPSEAIRGALQFTYFED